MKKNKIYEIVIVGGGISGIGCAKTLLLANKKFIMITPEIGGRIIPSNNTNYGAYLVNYQYKNVLSFVTIKNRVKLSMLYFYWKGKKYRLFSAKILMCLPALVRLLSISYKFRRQYKYFRKDCEVMGQKNALKKYPFLYKLYFQKQKDFIQEYRLEALNDYITGQALKSLLVFSNANVSAFSMIHWCAEFFISPMYAFHFRRDKVIKLFKEKIIYDKVTKILKVNSTYELHTKQQKQYKTKNLVIATEPWTAKDLLHLPKINTGLSISYMYHISGEIKKEWKNVKVQLSSKDHHMCSIVVQDDGSYLLYSEKPTLQLDEFFHSYEIISEKFIRNVFH